MCSTDCLKKALINLKTISKIEEGKKIKTKTSSKFFEIDEPWFFQKFTRRIGGEDRETALREIEKTIDSSLRFAQMYSSPQENDFIFKDDDFYLKDSRLIYDHLISAIPGLKNLALTYKDHDITVSNINLLINKIEKNTKHVFKNGDRDNNDNNFTSPSTEES